jgi:hypothetical protein
MWKGNEEKIFSLALCTWGALCNNLPWGFLRIKHKNSIL